MDVETASILTVGDELLAGEIENTNATWLAAQLTERGLSVREILVAPDELTRLQRAVRDHSDRYDSVVVTGGLGSTPDDVTVEAVAAGLDREVVRDEQTYDLVAAEVDAIQTEYPEFEFDIERGANRPAGSLPIENENGIAPGFVVENVFVLPGIPTEMKPMFADIADELQGSLHTRSVTSTEAESHLNEMLREADDRFDVFVGCYPNESKERKRITVRGSDEDTVEEAREWLLARPEVDG
jgi:nicotinamide-nucleotide amidase